MSPFRSTPIKGIRLMKIAVASQNRQQVTGHAGQCRRFWIVEIADQAVVGRVLVELEREETFHATGGGLPPALQGIDRLIAGGMGPGLRQRLAARGIAAIVTAETDVDKAIAGVLAGTLTDDAAAHDAAAGCHEHGHEHEHQYGHGCGCGHRH